MIKKKAILWIIFILLFPFSLLSSEHYEYVVSPEEDVYFAHISLTEVKYDGKDPVVLREGEKSPEIAVLNFPLTAGDTVRTTENRRCEIQFDTGTIIRLDYSTELKLEAVLAQSLSSRKKLTNLLLNRGQIFIMYRRYNSREVFQVLTANAAVKMEHNTVGTIEGSADGGTIVQVKVGKAYLLYGADADHLEEEKIKKMKRAVISPDHKLQISEYKPDVEFELWNEGINANFQELHRGKSFIPAPIKKYPEAVYYFAQKCSNLFGEWMWNSLYGYVWRPNYNDYYPWGNWQPYLYGQWREVNGQLFWVPEESWGWVPYHLGLWLWDKKYGWIWLPGSAFAPAWVAWDFLMGYYTWRPWSLMDWYYPLSYHDYYYGVRNYYGWRKDLALPYGEGGEKGKPIRRWIKKDQLKKRTSTSPSPSKKLKRAYQNFVKALNREDDRVLAFLEKIPEQMIVVEYSDLNAKRIQEKSMEIAQIPEQSKSSSPNMQVFPLKYPQKPYQKALWSFRRNKDVAELKAYVMSSLLQKGRNASLKQKPSALKEREGALDTAEKVAPAQRRYEQLGKAEVISPGKSRVFKISQSMRVRDWNPDVRRAQRIGVRISYSSRHNEVRCPELGITSKNVAVSRFGHSSRGGFYSSRSGGSSGSGSSSRSSAKGSSSGSLRGSSGHSHSSGHSKSGGKKK